MRLLPGESREVGCRMEPREYVQHLLDALDVNVTPAPVEDTPLTDYDDAMRRLHLAQQREEATPGIADDPHACSGTGGAAAAVPAGTQGRNRDNARHSPHTDIDHDADSESDDDGDTTDVVGRMAPADATPGTAVAVEFNLRRGRGVRFFKGTVMRLFAASARVRFREFDDTYLDYDIAHARLFIPSPTAD